MFPKQTFLQHKFQNLLAYADEKITNHFQSIQCTKHHIPCFVHWMVYHVRDQVHHRFCDSEGSYESISPFFMLQISLILDHLNSKRTLFAWNHCASSRPSQAPQTVLHFLSLIYFEGKMQHFWVFRFFSLPLISETLFSTSCYRTYILSVMDSLERNLLFCLTSGLAMHCSQHA